MRLTLAASDGPALDTVTVYENPAPALTGSAESILVTDRSAEVVIAVSSEVVSLPATGSVVEVVTEALLVIDPAMVPAGTVTAITTSTLAPSAIVPSEHVTVPASFEAGTLIRRGAYKYDTGRQHIGEADARRVGRTGIGHRHRVREASTSDRRIGAVGFRYG